MAGAAREDVVVPDWVWPAPRSAQACSAAKAQQKRERRLAVAGTAQVVWQRSDSHELQFYSVSTDGRVTLWSVSKNELSFQVRLLAGRAVHGLPKGLALELAVTTSNVRGSAA